MGKLAEARAVWHCVVGTCSEAVTCLTAQHLTNGGALIATAIKIAMSAKLSVFWRKMPTASPLYLQS